MDNRQAARCLNLGCGGAPLWDAVNHDLTAHSPWVDVAHDLDVTPWPWPDEAFDEIMAQDVLEHLRSFVAFFDECWRILKPGGLARIRTPRWDSLNAIIDPTHVRCYHPESFDYLDPATRWGRQYGVYYTRRHWRKEMVYPSGSNILVIMRKVNDAQANAA